MKQRFAWFLSIRMIVSVFCGFVLSFTLAFTVFKDKPACAVVLPQQNVLITGLDNPANIVVRGVPTDQVVISAQGATIVKKEGDRYIIRAKTPGEAVITVSGGDLPPTAFRYRVKRLPDPALLLGAKHRSSTMANGEFRAQGGVAAVMMYDICGHCEVIQYEVTYLEKGVDAVTVINSGARFNPPAQALIAKAKPGNLYYFDNVKVKCPGDQAARDLGSLAFRIR